MCDKCIYYFGIRGVSLKWFKYYLDNRTQMVKIQYKDEQVRSDPLRKGRTFIFILDAGQFQLHKKYKLLNMRMYYLTFIGIEFRLGIWLHSFCSSSMDAINIKSTGVLLFCNVFQYCKKFSKAVENMISFHF